MSFISQAQLQPNRFEFTFADIKEVENKQYYSVPTTFSIPVTVNSNLSFIWFCKCVASIGIYILICNDQYKYSYSYICLPFYQP